MKKVLIIIAVAIVVIAGALALTSKPSPKTSSPNSSSSSSSANGSAPDKVTAAATITYSDSGFSPSTVTVKSGDTILIKNVSSSPMQFDSDPHPVHTDDPELNIGEIAPGSSGTVKVITVGTHGYHNHLNPSQTGTIVVQ